MGKKKQLLSFSYVLLFYFHYCSQYATKGSSMPRCLGEIKMFLFDFLEQFAYYLCSQSQTVSLEEKKTNLREEREREIKCQTVSLEEKKTNLREEKRERD